MYPLGLSNCPAWLGERLAHESHKFHVGIVTNLARTRDFLVFERLGVISCPDYKDDGL